MPLLLPLLLCAAAAPAADPRFRDDEAITADFTRKLAALAKADKPLGTKKLRALADKDKPAAVKPQPPGKDPLTPEAVYRKALPSVFLIGSVLPHETEAGEYDTGRLATAWVLAADGVLVTNWHVFDKVLDGERYGVMDHDGNAYPLTDVLGVDKAADVAVVRVEAKGLAPLSLAAAAPDVAAWVAVLGHPGDRHFTFTQGHVSRFSRFTDPDTKAVSRWMAVTAEYAYGSSGSPVLDRFGAVVGMAALTESIDYPDEEEPAKNARRARMVRRPAQQKARDEKPKKEEPPPAPKGSALQMVVKLTVPVGELRRTLGGKE
jgi:S1-C subfamily serine protease